MEELTPLDLSILKYYKERNELCGFEGVHSNLCKLGYLNDDLELTEKGYQFIKDSQMWDEIETYNNKMYLRVKL